MHGSEWWSLLSVPEVKDFLFQVTYITVYSNEWKWRQSTHDREDTIFKKILGSLQKDMW